MSAICGIIQLDGAPVDPDLINKMAQAAAFRGPDGINTIIDGNIALAYLALNTSPESTIERQPYTYPPGPFHIIADAQIYNREEVVVRLRTRGYINKDKPSNAEILCAAYECWGSECPNYIVGDYAFAVWDTQQQKLFCARDIMGVRPFFYTYQGNTFYFASTISSLLAIRPDSPAFNDRFVTDFLSWKFDRWVNETIFDSIARLPPAHRLELDSNRMELTNYWRVDTLPAIHYDRDEEYYEHFLELFGLAVQSRFQGSSDIAMMVSGGLDSSSIACLAHKNRADYLAYEQTARLYLWSFQKFPAADEREHQNAVIEKCPDFPATVLDGDTLWGLKGFGAESSCYFDEPEIFPIRPMFTDLLARARSDGCRVVLTGEGGDHILNSNIYWNPEILLDFNLHDAVQEWKYFREYNGGDTGYLLKRLILAAFRPVVPMKLIEWRRKILGQKQALEWIKTNNYSENNNPIEEKVHLPSRSARGVYRSLTSGWLTALLSYYSSIAACSGVELRFPYLDRRLVEFMISIPPGLLISKGFRKSILRRSMVDILPELTRQRLKPSHYTEIVDYGLRQMEVDKIACLLDSFQAPIGKYLDLDRLAIEWQAYYNSNDMPVLRNIAPIFLQSWYHQYKRATDS
jgi:asparagine synthase (glutamine-hydrolysing)